MTPSILLVAACGGEEAPKIELPEAPTALAGDDRLVDEAGEITLDSSGSVDPDGAPLTRHWWFERLPEASMLDDSALDPNGTREVHTGFMPDALGVYVIGLEVEDTTKNVSPPDWVVIDVANTPAPVALAGDDVTIDVGAEVTLQGVESYDPAGRPLTFSWWLIDEEVPATLTDADADVARFSASEVGTYTVVLQVDNGLVVGDTDAVHINVVEP